MKIKIEVWSKMDIWSDSFGIPAPGVLDIRWSEGTPYIVEVV